MSKQNKIVKPCIYCDDGDRVEIKRVRKKVFSTLKKTSDDSIGFNLKETVVFESNCCGKTSILPIELCGDTVSNKKPAKTHIKSLIN